MEKLEVAPQETMMDLISSFWIARSIYLAAQLGVADVFDDQPKTMVVPYKSVGYVTMSFQVQGRLVNSARCAAVVPKHECCQIQLK